MAVFAKQPASRVILNQYLQFAGGGTPSTSLPSAAFTSETWQIRVFTTLAGYLTFGTVPSATVATVQSSSVFIPASTVGGEYFTVSPNTCIAFVSSSTSSGTLNITEMC